MRVDRLWDWNHVSNSASFPISVWIKLMTICVPQSFKILRHPQQIVIFFRCFLSLRMWIERCLLHRASAIKILSLVWAHGWIVGDYLIRARKCLYLQRRFINPPPTRCYNGQSPAIYKRPILPTAKIHGCCNSLTARAEDDYGLASGSPTDGKKVTTHIFHFAYSWVRTHHLQGWPDGRIRPAANFCAARDHMSKFIGSAAREMATSRNNFKFLIEYLLRVFV